MANQSPTQKICGCVDCTSREVLECRSAEEIRRWHVSIDRDNTNCRIWIEAGNNGIAEQQWVQGVEVGHIIEPSAGTKGMLCSLWKEKAWYYILKMSQEYGQPRQLCYRLCWFCPLRRRGSISGQFIPQSYRGIAAAAGIDGEGQKVLSVIEG